MQLGKDTKKVRELKTQNEQVSGPQASQNGAFREENLQVDLNELDEHRERKMIGGRWTFIGFQNPTSYALGTSNRGLKVLDESKIVYYKELPGGGQLRDIVYVDHLNCYLLSYRDIIFRKDIDTKDPYPIMNLHCCRRFGASFRYSKLNTRLITCWRNFVYVVNVDRKQVEIVIKRSNLMGVEDFRIFGEKENKLVFLSSTGFVHLFSISYSLKKICRDQSYKIKLDSVSESALSVAVCDKGQYILAGLADQSTFRSSRLIILRVDGRSLVKLATLDLQYGRIGMQYALEFFGSAGNHILWVGLSMSGYVHLYDLNCGTGYFREVVDKRVQSREENMWKIHRLGEKLYYTGYGAKVIELSLTI